MAKQNTPDISPLIAKWHPLATPDEQRQYTQEFRAYLAVLYRIFLRLDSAGLFTGDSRESADNAMVESDNPDHS